MSSKRMTDRKLLTRLATVRKSIFARGGNPLTVTRDDADDVLHLFMKWCEDWTPQE